MKGERKEQKRTEKNEYFSDPILTGISRPLVSIGIAMATAAANKQNTP